MRQRAGPLAPQEQEKYVRSLAGRNIAALALQTACHDSPLPERRISRQNTDRGPHLPTILDFVATALAAEVSLASADGMSLDHEGSAFEGEGPTAQLANARLLESVIEGSGAETVEWLWLQAGLQPGQGAVMAVFRSLGREANFSAVERALRARGGNARAHLWDGELAMLFVLPRGNARKAREALLRAARDAVRGTDACAAFGPNVDEGLRAHESYVEAQATLGLGLPEAGKVLDAMEFLARRILAAVPEPGLLALHVRPGGGEVLDRDRKHGTALMASLLCSLDSGSNTTASAPSLNVERQTMHKRLNKIQDLLGGDPRDSGSLLELHIAEKAAAATEAAGQRRPGRNP